MMLAIAHQLADVVQQGGRFEQEALLFRRAHPLAQLIVEREGQQPDVLDVPAIAMAAFHEFPNQAERVVRGGRRFGTDHLEQQTLAESERAHLHLPGLDPEQQLRGHRETGQDDVRPLRVEPGDLAPLLGGHRGEPLEEMLDLGRVDCGAMYRIGSR